MQYSAKHNRIKTDFSQGSTNFTKNYSIRDTNFGLNFQKESLTPKARDVLLSKTQRSLEKSTIQQSTIIKLKMPEKPSRSQSTVGLVCQKSSRRVLKMPFNKQQIDKKRHSKVLSRTQRSFNLFPQAPKAMQIPQSHHHINQEQIKMKASMLYSQVSQEVPESIKTQPSKSLFLCTICYEYFLIPQKETHAKICHFEQSQTLIEYKFNRIKEMLKVIYKKTPNNFISLIIKKIGRYLSEMIDIEDILMLSWFIEQSQLEVGLDWKELFQTIEQLGKRRESIKQKRSKQFCFFCG